MLALGWSVVNRDPVILGVGRERRLPGFEALLL